MVNMLTNRAYSTTGLSALSMAAFKVCTILYDYAALYHAVFCSGYNATVFAYGQTGSGKTFTMGGACSENEPSEAIGIIPRVLQVMIFIMCCFFSSSHSLQSVFDRVSSARKNGVHATIRVTYIEIYNEEALDLLGEQHGRRGLAIRERADGAILITGANETVVATAADALALFDAGNHARTVGPTNMNAQSSRSHAIMTVSIEQQQQLSTRLTTSEAPSSASSAAEWITTNAKFHLVFISLGISCRFLSIFAVFAQKLAG